VRGCLAYPIIHPAFANDKITEYCSDSDQVLAEYDYNSVSEDCELARKFVYGPGIDEPICMIVVAGESETVYYYHFDGLGSVAALSDVNSMIVERYSYDVFGEPNRVSGVHNPYMFTGRRFDSETGLYYYRARYYKPEIGRFLQTDPIGYGNGLNLYTYCGNNPINWIDPYGEAWWNPIDWVRAIKRGIIAIWQGAKSGISTPADAGRATLQGGTTCLAYRQTVDNLVKNPDFIMDPNYGKLRRIAEIEVRSPGDP